MNKEAVLNGFLKKAKEAGIIMDAERGRLVLKNAGWWDEMAKQEATTKKSPKNENSGSFKNSYYTDPKKNL